MAYYYLLSSLPLLSKDGNMPISYGQFLDLCREGVSSAKYEILENLSVTSRKGPLISEWAAFYDMFREELAYQRNQRLGRKARVPFQRDEGVSAVISKALASKNPLDAENMLLALQFERLDEMVGVHYFDDYALMGYALKLKLLERREGFNKEKGKTEFARIVDTLERQIISMKQE